MGDFAPLPDRTDLEAGNVLPQTFTLGVKDNFDALASTDPGSGASLVAIDTTDIPGSGSNTQEVLKSLSDKENSLEDFVGELQSQNVGEGASLVGFDTTTHSSSGDNVQNILDALLSNISTQVVDASAGQTTRAAGAGTGTQNIAHGLNGAPKLIKIRAWRSNIASEISQYSDGSAKSVSSESCTYWYIEHDASNNLVKAFAQDSSNIIRLRDSVTNPLTLANISAINDTNFTLNFTTHANPTNSTDVFIQWEAFTF